MWSGLHTVCLEESLFHFLLKSQCVWVTWCNKLEWRHLPNIVQFPFVQPKWLWHFEAWTPGLSWCSVLIMLWSLWSCGLDCWSLSGFGLFLQRVTAWLDWNLGCLEAWLTLCQVRWAVLEKFSQPTVLSESYDNTPDISHECRKWRCLLFSMSITFLNWKVTPPFLKVCLIIMWLNVTEHFPAFQH